MKKAGIIRCQQTEDICPGTTDFKFAAMGKGAFAETGPVEIAAFVSCGGCPGKRAVSRAAVMIERGVEIIVLASCIKNGNPIGFPCPHRETMKEAISKKAGEKIKIMDYTH
jgi:predicted metal-binding protein